MKNERKLLFEKINLKNVIKTFKKMTKYLLQLESIKVLQRQTQNKYKNYKIIIL
jgi:hypothetical protein